MIYQVRNAIIETEYCPIAPLQLKYGIIVPLGDTLLLFLWSVKTSHSVNFVPRPPPAFLACSA